MPLPGITVANGQVITITGTGVCDGSYTVQFTGEYFGNYVVGVYGEVPTFGPATCTINYTTAVEILTYISLKDVLRLCLMATNLELNYRVLAQLLPRSPGGTERWLDDTFIDGRSFLNDSTWQSCYDVLESIMKRFYASCFQSNGAWYIVRWGELWRYQTSGGSAFLGYQYDTNFDYDIDYTENNNFNFGNGDDIETGWLKSIVRPYQFVKETFNYSQATALLCNYDLQNLGDLRTTYIVGTQRYDEYEWTCWETQTFWPLDTASGTDRYIRVITDLVQNKEVDRYGVLVRIPGQAGTHSAQSAPIQVAKGDVITFSFSIATQNAYTSYTETNLKLNLHTNTQFLSFGYNNSALSGVDETYWKWSVVSTTIPVYEPWYFSIFTGNGDDSTKWQEVTVTTTACPDAGELYVYLSDFFRSAAGDTYYKNFSLTISNAGNNIQNIIGHTHKDSQIANIKNVSDVEILMDDSISPTLRGTLFLFDYDGFIRNKTTVWNYKYRGSEYNFPLGQTTTFEEMYQRYLPRTKYNGVLLDLNQGAGDGFMLSMASTIKYTLTDPLRFVFGSLSINYANDTADCTLWQMCNGEESITDLELIDLYEFKYLYQNN
jgi:hypothetical protein